MKKLIFCTLTMSLAFSCLAFAAVSEEEIYTEEMKKATIFVNENYPNIPDEEKAIIIERLYESRPKDTDIEGGVSLPLEPYIKEEDPAYIAMDTRVKYVVNLINSMGGEATILSWEGNLDFLTEHYDEIKEREDVDLAIIDTYIMERISEKEFIDMPDKKVYEGISLLTTDIYDFSEATSYASRYLYNYNSDYPDWTPLGGDCANFVSQCLYEGGKSMTGTDSTSPTSWFSYGNIRDTTRVAEAWRSANVFKNYWTAKATEYNTFPRGGIDTYNYTWQGDVVSMLYADGIAYHTLICYTYNSIDKTTTLYSHTGTAKRDLNSITVPVRIYHMRSSYPN